MNAKHFTDAKFEFFDVPTAIAEDGNMEKGPGIYAMVTGEYPGNYCYEFTIEDKYVFDGDEMLTSYEIDNFAASFVGIIKESPDYQTQLENFRGTYHSAEDYVENYLKGHPFTFLQIIQEIWGDWYITSDNEESNPAFAYNMSQAGIYAITYKRGSNIHMVIFDHDVMHITNIITYK